MSTVVRRTFCSTPQRDASQTWTAIVDLLTHDNASDARTELLTVKGVAASVIADKAPSAAAIVVTCEGPRTRIYCLYDDDAIEGSDANEDALGFDPLKGEWKVSLPCQADDLAWVQGALKQHSDRITARDSSATTAIENTEITKEEVTLVLDPKGFLGS